MIVVTWHNDTVSSSQTSSWLDLLRLLEVIKHSRLALHVLHSLSVNVVHLDHIVCHICIIVVLVGDDALRVQVIAVDCGDHSLIERCVVVVLSHHCLLVGIICLDHALLGWQLDNFVCGDAWRNGWWRVAARVHRRQCWQWNISGRSRTRWSWRESNWCSDCFDWSKRHFYNF